MIKNIIDLLNSQEWLIGDEDIDFAKGKYQAPTTWKELKDYAKRIKHRK